MWQKMRQIFDGMISGALLGSRQNDEKIVSIPAAVAWPF
jgi:hypothetical protein